jgi:hypothetical protein
VLFATSRFPADQCQPERRSTKKKIQNNRPISTKVFRPIEPDITVIEVALLNQSTVERWDTTRFSAAIPLC